MKNDIYLKLNPIEKQLKSVLISNYARLSANDFDEFCSVYKQHYGEELSRSERNCNACRLKALKRIANDYFQYQEWYMGRWGRKPEDPKPENTDENNVPNEVEKIENNSDKNNEE